MQQSGRCRRKNTQGTEKNETAVKPHHKTVVPADAAHQTVRQAAENKQLTQILCGDGDVGNFSRNGSTAANGNPHISEGERERR